MTYMDKLPITDEQERFDRVQRFAARYWWLGFLGLWEWLHPLFRVFYIFLTLLPVAIGLGWLSSEASPTAWIETRDPSGVQDRFRKLLSTVHPTVVGQSLIHWIGAVVVRGRGLTPDPDEFDQTQSFRLPVDGEWTVLAGSTEKAFTHDNGVPQHRYAYDFGITDDDGSTFDKDTESESPETHYCYGEPVLAPADGTIARVRSDRREPDRAIGAPDLFQRSIYGNVVVIDHGDVATVLAHLQPGSVTVERGDRVNQGDQIGACGQSGNVSEPQLHAHVQDRSRPAVGIALPIKFDDVTVQNTDTASEVNRKTVIQCGQQVGPVDTDQRL